MRHFPPPIRLPPPPPPPSSRHRRRDAWPTVGVVDSHLNIVPTLMANKEENSDVGRSKCNRVYVNLPYNLSRCTNKTSSTNIESLPDDLVLKILVHLRAEVIFEAAMAVCRKWYNMIHTHNFINAHLENSTPGVLLLHDLDSKYPTCVLMVEGRIEISKINYEFVYLCWSSCNGLSLEYLVPDHVDTHGLCIINAITRQRFELPPFGFFYPRSCDYSGIAYAAASMEYKVVCISSPDESGNTPVALLGFAILTVGVDESWRHVQTEHLSLKTKELFTNTPLTTEGFLHWTSREVGTHILTLNVATEIITEIRVPTRCNGGQESRYYLSNGRSLTVLVSCSEFSWDVWELKRPEIGEWVKMIHINVEGLKWKFEHLAVPIIDLDPVPLTLEPIGWLNYYEGLVVQVCRPAEGCFVYNVSKQEIELLELDVHCYYIRSRAHKNSLVWLDG